MCRANKATVEFLGILINHKKYLIRFRLMMMAIASEGNTPPKASLHLCCVTFVKNGEIGILY